MANTLLTNHLKEFGLSEKEALAYIALLELEVATAHEIAKKSGLNRSSTYVVLESLQKKGLAAISGGATVLRYVATMPEVLLQMAQDAADKQSDIYKKISAIVPDLKALHKDTRQKPRVRIYEGIRGIFQVVDEALDKKEPFLRLVASLSDFGFLIPYFPKIYQKAAAKKLVTHGIHPDDALSRQLAKLDPTGLNDQILIPKEKYTFPANFAIYDDKVGFMFSKKGGVAIVIENREIAEVMKTIFDMAWTEAKRIRAKSAVRKKK